MKLKAKKKISKPNQKKKTTQRRHQDKNSYPTKGDRDYRDQNIKAFNIEKHDMAANEKKGKQITEQLDTPPSEPTGARPPARLPARHPHHLSPHLLPRSLVPA